MFKHLALMVVAGALAAVLAGGGAATAAPAAAPAAPAAPATRGNAGVDPDGLGVHAGYRHDEVTIVAGEGATPPQPGVRRPPTHWCGYWPATLSPEERFAPGYLDDPANIARHLGPWPAIDGDTGAYPYWVQCFGVGESTPYEGRLVWYTPPRPGDPPRPLPGTPDLVSIETVEVAAHERLALVAPAVTASPPAGRQVVGVETWVDVAPAAPLAVTAQAGELWATARATVSSVTVDFGDGRDSSVVRCTPPATARPPAERPGCLRHTYVVSRSIVEGAWPFAASFAYDVTTATSLDPAPRPVGVRNGPVAPLAMVVRPVQAVVG